MATKRKRRLYGLVLWAALAGSGVCFAMIWGQDTGAWSADWPKELEPYRKRASSMSERPIGGGVVYTIPFADQRDFEKMWPVILSLKSKGAPLILRSGGVEMKRQWNFGSTPEPQSGDSSALRVSRTEQRPEGVYPGVKIFAPQASLFPKGSSGHVNAAASDRSTMGRSTVEVELFVGDGQVVDLNRIRLPEETPIVDRRELEGEAKVSTTRPGENEGEEDRRAEGDE
jgi:hypothetical protein